jgi:hypothetical protein
MFAALPFLALPLLGYNLFVFVFLPGGRHALADPALMHPLFSVRMASGAPLSITGDDLIALTSLLILFVELLRSTSSRHIALINHSLSMLLFIVCLVEFLVLKAFASFGFFFITMAVLLDVLAGFIVSLASSRRE